MMRVWIAVWTGSSKLAELIADWIRPNPVLKPALILGAGMFIKGLPWTWNIATALACMWLLTAVIVGLRLPDPTATAATADTSKTDESTDPEGGQAEASDSPVDGDVRSDGWTLHEQLTFALHAVGAPHAHITALAEHLQAPTDRVREALTGAGIPISGGVRMKGRPVAVSPGVKNSDFPPLPSPAQEGTQEGALTSNNNDNNNGYDFTTVPDKDDPARTHVVRPRP